MTPLLGNGITTPPINPHRADDAVTDFQFVVNSSGQSGAVEFLLESWSTAVGLA